jgi:hypothetical protein
MPEYENCCDLSGAECPCDTSETDCPCPCPCPSTEEETGLRLRNEIATLEPEIDLSGNVLIVQNQTQMEDKMIYLYLQGMLYLLRFLNWSLNSLQSAWSVTKKVSYAVKESMKDEMYVFFNGSSYPYRVKDIHLDHPGTPPIEWYYNASTQSFISSRVYNSSQTYQTKHIPYLTAEIKYNDLTLYDASDYINSVRWVGEEMPNARQLISAWTVHSGIVLQVSKDMTLFVIDTDGSERKVSLTGAD